MNYRPLSAARSVAVSKALVRLSRPARSVAAPWSSFGERPTRPGPLAKYVRCTVPVRKREVSRIKDLAVTLLLREAGYFAIWVANHQPMQAAKQGVDIIYIGINSITSSMSTRLTFHPSGGASGAASA